MKLLLTLTTVSCLWIAGCGPKDSANSSTSDNKSAGATSGDTSAGETSGDTSTEATSGDAGAGAGTSTTSATGATAPSNESSTSDTEEPKPVPVEAGIAKLSQDNTTIQFVGTHAPPKAPEPRTGWFAKFSGEATVGDDGRLKSVSADIVADSLWTPIDKLTNHLKSQDFLDTRVHPTAKFVSTKIETEDGATTITGDFTLHGTTKEITFPAMVTIDEEGLTLSAEFDIDRTQFGIDNEVAKGTEELVKLTVAVGKKTEPTPSGG